MKNQKISVDIRIVCLFLLAVIVGMLLVWKPWSSTVAKRTISISAEASQKAEPDEYQFTPNYQEKGANRAAIQKTLSDKITGVIAKLKELGVKESDITLASSTYENYFNDGTNEVTLNSLTITVTDKALSQKIQDYLLTTSPQGQITPYPTFSTEKRKQLEDEVRSTAIANAKKKATTTATDLGAKLGKVVSITDKPTVGFPVTFQGGAEPNVKVLSSGASSSLPVLPGKQNITYSVEIVYELR